MVSTRDKGMQNVRRAIKYLQDHGYLAWNPGAKAHFIGPGKCVSMRQDILGCYDVIARRKNQALMLVQVTTITGKTGGADKTGTATARRRAYVYILRCLYSYVHWSTTYGA